MKTKYSNIQGIFALTIFLSLSTIASGQSCTVCNALVDIEISPDFPGTTVIDPADIFSGDINCVSSMSVSPSTVDCSNIGLPVPVTLTVQETNGATTTCFSTIKPADFIAPTILIQSDVTIDSEAGMCGATYGHPEGTSPTVSDNCDSVWPEFVSGIPDGGFYPVGVNRVTWSATDSYGNRAEAFYTVTVLPAPIAVNTWTPDLILMNSDWSIPENWSLSEVPTLCHDVVIPTAIVDPTIPFGYEAFAHSVTINADAKLTNQGDANLTIFNFVGAGIINHGTVDNQGGIQISTASTVNGNGLENHGAFTNSDYVELKSIAKDGIVNFVGANFTNGAFMNVGKNASENIEGIGIINDGTFLTYRSLNISHCGNHGILNNSAGTFTNQNGLSVSDVVSDGVYNSGQFINDTPAGILSIQGTGRSGIFNVSGKFDNDAKLLIGHQVNIGHDGIHNRGVLTNATAGNIEIDNTGFGGIANFATGEITNEGIINIGNNGGMISHQSIYNSGVITNISGASLSLKGGNFSLLNVDIPGAGAGTFNIQLGSTLIVDK